MCGSITCQNHLHGFDENQCLSQSALPESWPRFQNCRSELPALFHVSSAECLTELLALSHVSPPFLSKSSMPPISFLCIYAQALVPRRSPTPRLHRNLPHNLFHFWKFLFEIFNSKSYYHVITNIFHRPSASRGRFRVLPSFASPHVPLPSPPGSGLSSSSMQQTNHT